MTAINPARLKIQCAELVEFYSSPHQFKSRLHDLLGFYAARIRQTSLSRTPLTLQIYQVPAPVLRALINELEPLMKAEPDAGLKLIDVMWKEEWVEFRQLAIICLGKIPPAHTRRVLERVDSWLKGCTAEDVRRKIMRRALSGLGAEQPEVVFDYIDGLIEAGSKMDHQAALFGLMAFAANPDFDNLPMIFSLLGKILQSEESGLVKEITSLVRALGKRSEQETVYFLERQLGRAAKPRILRVTRQALVKFSRENQALLRNSLDIYS